MGGFRIRHARSPSSGGGGGGGGSGSLMLFGTPPAGASVGSAYNFQPVVTGGTSPYTWAITNKPAWATFSTSTGLLSGTPTGAETDSGIIITVTDSASHTLSLATFTVTVASGVVSSATTSNYNSVFASANPGDIIELASGTYSGFNPYNVNKAAPGVTIRPAASASVVFAGSHPNSSAGINFTNNGSTRITSNAKWNLQGCDRITFDGVDFAGNSSTYTTDNIVAWVVNGSSNVTIKNCTAIYCLDVIATQNGTPNLTIQNNDFSYSYSDFVHLIGDATSVLVAGNTIHHGTNADLLHQDFIQIAGTNRTANLVGLWVINNKIIRESGGSSYQGVFIQSGDGIEGNYPLLGVIVAGNMIMSGNYWGVGIEGCLNPIITGNYINGYVGALDPTNSNQMYPWIRYSNSSGVTVTNNVVDNGGSGTTPYLYDSGDNVGTTTTTGNTYTTLAAADDLTAANAWWVANH